ncbi:MAG: tetratricopeptide repeat protein [Anaerolineae bacterium]
MYVKTPKRYAKRSRRSPISLRWLWLWIATPIFVIVGIQIYNNRAEYAPPVEQAINSAMQNLQSGISTAVAPTLAPTENPAASLAQAENDWRQGRIESAIDTYQKVISGAPNDVVVHARLAFGLVMEGRDQAALESAESAITANPFASDAWAILSLALDRNRRYGEAVASALRALEIDPNNASAMAFLAQSYYDMGEYDLARSTSDRALEIDPENFQALNVRGVIAQGVEFDLVLAKDYYKQAHDIAPNLPILAIDLANITYGLGVSSGDDATSKQGLSDAIGILSDVIEVNPQNAPALYWLGYLYFRGEGNFSQAAEMLRRCLDSNPDSIDCNAYLGRVLAAMDDNDGAVTYLQKAVDLGSTISSHWFWLGRAQKALGRCDTAIPNLQEGRDLAQIADNSDVVAAAEELLRECQIPLGISPTVEATAEADSG